jgi:hypothetical protein
LGELIFFVEIKLLWKKFVIRGYGIALIKPENIRISLGRVIKMGKLIVGILENVFGRNFSSKFFSVKGGNRLKGQIDFN